MCIKTGRAVNLSSLRMQNSFYKLQTNASAIRFAVLGCGSMRSRHARVAQVGTVTNRIAGKANERTTERDSLESVRTPWPSRRDRLSHLLPTYSHSREGGRKCRCCRRTLESQARSSFPTDERRAARWCQPNFLRRSSLLAPKSEPLTVLELSIKIHAIWNSVSIFLQAKIVWLMRIVLYGNESCTKKE